LFSKDDERYESSHAGEDMYGVPGNFIFYEIVRTGNSNVFQHPALHNSLSSASILLFTTYFKHLPVIEIPTLFMNLLFNFLYALLLISQNCMELHNEVYV
jgi:hypothetical protein